MELTRKNFITSSAAFASAFGLDPAALAKEASKNPFRAADYAALRKELRAFYPPGYCRLECQSKEQVESARKIGAELDAWAAAHPGFDALDIRRESYLLMRKHFLPFLFDELPFYFEAGVNGGWSGARPARHVNRICGRFYREQNLIPKEAFALKDRRWRERLALCCGPFVDDMHHVPPFRRILKSGFGGVRAEVAEALAKCPKDDPLGRKQLETALVGLDTIHEIQLKFAAEARRRLAARGRAGNVSGASRNPEDRRLERIAEAAARCPWEPPRTFFEGLNTLWFVREILGYVDGVNHFSLGRPDAMLIDLYCADLKAGRLTVEEARDLVARFLIAADCHESGNVPVKSYDDQEAEIPMSVGGCDADGRPLCNELTEMFLDAHIGCDCVFPKMHCRISASSPEPYLRKIGAMLMQGHAVFTLINDDRTVAQFVRDGYAPEEARQYVGCGCWNGWIDSVHDVDGANYISLVRILEMTIYRNPELERTCRIKIEPIDDAASFEAVRDTVCRNILRFFRDVTGEYTRWGRANAKVFPHPVYSCCLKGGIESRRDTTDGGIPAPGRPRMMTLGFLSNLVDSLAAIRQLCFVDRVCTVREFLDVVRSNWQGVRGEELRKAALAAPYWGDGSAVTNGLMGWYMKAITDGMDGAVTDQGDSYRFAIYTYREFMYWGDKTRATPDGRRDGDQLSQGFSPSELRCKSGATTVLNAIGTLPHDRLYASNVNLTFERSAMTEETWAAVLRVFCKKGSHMIQPNCNSVEELMDAQAHPERHQNLVVRVCGFSARFVNLSKRWQDEVIARHRLL